MKTYIVGTGGVGGYFGGKLAHSGYDVTFIARGKHYDIISNDGLTVKSTKGNFKVMPKVIDSISKIENPDLILLGVKSWQVSGVAQELKSVINDNTMVLPLQNGADNADKLRAILPDHNCLAGLCKIVSKIEAPGIINHFSFEPEIIFGEYDNSISNRVSEIKTMFDKAGFKNKLSTTIHLDIWRKFVFIASLSGIAALTRVNFGEMRKHNGIRQIILDSAKEIQAIANAKNIPLSDKDIEFVIIALDKSDFETTASTQRDIMEGKASELHNFNGYVVEQGKLLNIGTPTNNFIYQCLIPQEDLARRI